MALHFTLSMICYKICTFTQNSNKYENKIYVNHHPGDFELILFEYNINVNTNNLRNVCKIYVVSFNFKYEIF